MTEQQQIILLAFLLGPRAMQMLARLAELKRQQDNKKE